MNGKAKGSSFERTISKILSLWISEGKDKDLLWRSHSSGARFTSRVLKEGSGESLKGQSGDLCGIKDEGFTFCSIFSIETKFYSSFDLADFLLPDKKQGILCFWKQTKRDAERSGKEPLLICKKNYSNAICCFSYETMNLVLDKLLPKEVSYLCSPRNDASIVLLFDLIQNVSYKDFICLVQKKKRGTK
jgi:hypothetical protein